MTRHGSAARSYGVSCFFFNVVTFILLLAQQFQSVDAEDLTPESAEWPSRLKRDDDSLVPYYVVRHAPMIWLHSQDPFRPSDLLTHIRHTKPMINQELIPNVPELDLDNLDMLNDFMKDGQVALSTTSVDDVTNLAPWLLGETPDAAGNIHNGVPCVVVLVDKGDREMDAFYFYFYSYDRGPNITQVLPPLNSVIKNTGDGLHFGNHVGDWEHNMVRFKDGLPTGVYFSQHEGGAAYEWGDPALSLKHDRPVVYSAYGSHANWASEGDHVHDYVLVDYCDAGHLWDPVSSAYFLSYDAATETVTRMYALESTSLSSTYLDNSTSFFYFDGIWGDEQYPDKDPRQMKVPYFGMPRYNSGPTGPKWKQLVRKGLMPDHISEDKGMKWAVGVFMSWYPCCIRGWRKWVSALVVLSVLGSVITAVVFLVKWIRRRRRGYKRIDVDIPLHDLSGHVGERDEELDTGGHHGQDEELDVDSRKRL